MHLASADGEDHRILDSVRDGCLPSSVPARKHGQVMMLLVLCWTPASAQGTVSGIPGDGISDFYYFDTNSGPASTSLGPLARPVGTLLLDTDGTDIVAVVIGGADVVTGAPDDGNHLMGSTDQLPDPNAGPRLFASAWTAGFIGGRSQWAKTHPLDTTGFVGVIGEYADPFSIFPDLGLANYGPGATFDASLEDAGEFWEVLYAPDSSGAFFTNVTIVPPPTTGDFDDNGLYECADIDALTADIVGPGTPGTFDLTGDGLVDLDDRDAWLAEGAAANGFGSPYLLGDADLSGTVDFIDLNRWSQNRFTPTAAFCSGDWNASGFVDFIDLNHWSENRFQSSDSLVPEPSSMALLLLLGLVAIAHRRRVRTSGNA